MFKKKNQKYAETIAVLVTIQKYVKGNGLSSDSLLILNNVLFY